MRAPALLCLLVLAGCPCTGERTLLTASFEQCSDLCGFASPGGATRVDTVHPGEHGVALASLANLTAGMTMPAADGSPVTVRMTLNCGTDIQAHVVGSQLVVILPAGPQHDVHGGFQRASVTISLPQGSPTLGSLLIQNGSSACTIDDVTVSQPDPQACAG